MFVRIAFTRSLAEAGRLQSLLEFAGFHPVPIDSSSHVTIAGAEQGYHVQVSSVEAQAASDFLKRTGVSSYLET